MKDKTSVTSSLSNKDTLTDAQVNAGFDFNTILTSPDLNGQLYDIDSQVNIITKEICNFLTNNGVTLNSGDNSQVYTLLNSLFSAKQNTLVAGANITIDENNVISTTGSSPANIPLFWFGWLDSKPQNVSWVNASNYSWLYASTYVSAYEKLDSQLNPVGTFIEGDSYYVCMFSDGESFTTTVPVNSGTLAQLESWCSSQGYTYSGATIEELECYMTLSASSETIEGITITYYETFDGKKIVVGDSEIANAESIYNATGSAWYYIMDTVNQRFKLPRTKYGFTGIRDTVGKYVPETLPNASGHFLLVAGASIDEASLTGVFSMPVKDKTATQTGGALVSTGPVEFNLSSSSSTYQNSAPVQQRANQMYLYFYVGNFTQTAIENTAGLNAELFNDKADTDLNNINPSSTAKNLITSYNTPDSTNYTDLTLPTSGQTVTIPEDGILSYSVRFSGRSSMISFEILDGNSNIIRKLQCNAAYDNNSGGWSGGLEMRVAQGDVVTVYYGNITSTIGFRLIKLKGNN